jgi:hypothetical protein
MMIIITRKHWSARAFTVVSKEKEREREREREVKTNRRAGKRKKKPKEGICFD